MHASRKRQRFIALLGVLIVLSLIIIPAANPTTATHSGDGMGHQWGTYKWKNTTPGSPIKLNVRDNSRGAWATEFNRAVYAWDHPYDVTRGQIYGSDNPQLPIPKYPTNLRDGELRDPGQLWAQSRTTPIDLVPSTGTLASKTCKPTAGYIEVCNYPYGNKGWSGLAQIWLSGGSITQATAKMNETYFTTSYYRGFANPAAALAADRQLVMCQEIAHGFGLDHDDEDFGNPNTGTCMDYGDSPFFDEHPRYYDYVMLERMYCPSGSGCTGTATQPTTQSVTAGDELSDDPRNWGQVTARDSKGRPSHFEKDLGNGKKVLTFVIYPREVPADEVIDPGQGDASQAGSGHTHGGHSHEATEATGGHSNEDDRGKKADSKRGGKKADSKRDGKRGR